jgi:hypothetical protein
LKKLEKHAENLEAMVSRRTAELQGEKQKTEMLLNRMLPRSFITVAAVCAYLSWLKLTVLLQ